MKRRLSLISILRLGAATVLARNGYIDISDGNLGYSDRRFAAKGAAVRAISIVIGCALALSVLVLGIASAQVPYIAVYFDSGYTQQVMDCQGVGVIDTWHVVAVNFNRSLSGAEFAIHYPQAVMWIADLNTPPVTLNYTPTGISMGFPIPQNGYNPVPLCDVLVMWNCDECGSPFEDNQVKVVENPATGFLGAVDYPGFNLVPGLGLTAWICGHWCMCVPTKDTTWGGVKALYTE